MRLGTQWSGHKDDLVLFIENTSTPKLIRPTGMKDH